ncbi:MAG TPA: carbohydrate kinase family protein [Candidatus Saccharimonadales bacterium]|nr:carbohydrate kinase family protein [Candidatus Saccharimonadales bacterium]
MNRKLSVVTIGAATQDVFLTGKTFAAKRDVRTQDNVEQFPLGAKLPVEDVHFDTGGGGTNSAVTFARQGFNVSTLAKVGHDSAGAEVIRVLRREGAVTNHLAFDAKLKTGYSVILTAPKGERTVLVYRGASHNLQVQDFPLRNLEADWFYISSLAGNLDLLERLLKYANAHGIEVALDPGNAELEKAKDLKRLLPLVRVLKANREEFAMLFGNGEPNQLLRAAADQVQYAIMTDGGKGCLATDGASLYQCGQYQKVKVVDRTGSGDAFGSGFVAALARGDSIEQALTLASANATAVVRKVGAKDGILQAGARLKKMDIEVSEL